MLVPSLWLLPQEGHHVSKRQHSPAVVVPHLHHTALWVHSLPAHSICTQAGSAKGVQCIPYNVVITLASWHLPWHAALALCCQRASHPDEVARVLGQQLSSITVGLQLRHVSAVSVHVHVCVCVCVSNGPQVSSGLVSGWGKQQRHMQWQRTHASSTVAARRAPASFLFAARDWSRAVRWTSWRSMRRR